MKKTLTANQVVRELGLLAMVLGIIICLVAWAFGESSGRIAVALAGIVGIGGVTARLKYFIKSNDFRGRRLKDYAEVRAECDTKRHEQNPEDKGVLWGRLRIPSDQATAHFCVVGAVGSGKTLTIRMLMNDQLPLITPGSDRRALVYDAKQEMVPIVKSLAPKVPICLLNPFDQRATAWDIARDIRGPAEARQLAMTLVPDVKESQPFFTDSVRELLIAVVLIFLKKAPTDWTLRHVLLVMKSRQLLRQVLCSHPQTKNIYQNFLEGGGTTPGSILATVATKLGPFEPIAAAWEHSAKEGRKVSIRQWLRSDAILILGNDERVRSSLDTVNQLFVALTAQHVLAETESDTRRNWFFFDEFREAGKLSGLESIILRGRSKGCCVVLGFQDIQGVQHVYEEKLGNELVGQCGNKALLRIESPETAEWASRSVGDQELIQLNETWATKGPQKTASVTTSVQTRAEVLASEFMDLPATGRGNGLHGVYMNRVVGAYKTHDAWSDVIENIGVIDSKVKTFIEAPMDWQYLEDWSNKDATLLGFETTGGLGDIKRVEH